MRRRRVPNLCTSKPRVSFREMTNEKPSELMKFYGISEKGMQQELNKHCGDATQQQQKKEYEKVYGKKG